MEPIDGDISMKKALLAAMLALSVSACVAGGGTPANNGAALTSAENALAGTWSGNLPSGTPVRVVVTPTGAVSYYYKGALQRLNNVKMAGGRMSASTGSNGSTVSLTTNGAYVFTWGPTGEVTRATLVKG
jgi:hypothetical protein